MNLHDLYDLDYGELEALLAAWGESPVHARTIWRALYRLGISDLRHLRRAERHHALPASLCQRLPAEATLAVPAVVASRASPDGATRKDLLRLADGETIEVVLLRYRERYSACISTQVGCACGCRFCATGQMGFRRDLSAGEIVAQALHAQRALRGEGAALSNVVLMGMGEPLLNVEATLGAIRRLCDPRGMALAARRVTLSTVGVPAGIERLAEAEVGVRLALSLHAATDAQRTALMPINRRYPLDTVFAALRAYSARTGRRVMLEWLLLAATTTAEQAEALVARLTAGPTPIDAHVNLIRLNPTSGFAGRPTALEDATDAAPQAVGAFTAVLDRAAVPHTLRQRRGGGIAAGCGQLRQRNGERQRNGRR